MNVEPDASDAAATGAGGSRRERLRRWAPAVGLLIAFVVVCAAVVPRLEADGSARVTAFDLGRAQPVPELRTRGRVERNADGFIVPGFARASVAFTAAAPAAREGERTVLLVTAGATSGAETRLVLVDGANKRRQLGRFGRWSGHRVDVTEFAGAGPLRLELSATSYITTPLLFADQVRVLTYPPRAVPHAGRWEVAGWVALAVLLGLAALGRVRRHAALPAAAGLTAFLAWPDVKSSALEPLRFVTWESAVDADWIDLHTGLVSGTFGPLSSLTVQLFHAATPLTGTGAAGARTAGMLVGVAAVVAVYALGWRVAGALGAAVAVACALLTDAFRLSLTTGDATGTLVLAACLFLVAVHRALGRADVAAMAWLGAAGALAILAEPTWWPGVVASIVLIGLRCPPAMTVRRGLAVALLVLVVLSLPSRVSVAHQMDGDLNGDVVERATRARNAEFVGRGHGAPPDREALAAAPGGGERVGLVEYVIGDHSLSVAMGGTLSGAYDSLDATAERPESKLPGLVAFAVAVAGAVFLVLVPRLRLLVLVPALLALLPWFFASRDAFPAFAAGAAFWPALLAGAAALAYAVAGTVRAQLGSRRTPSG